MTIKESLPNKPTSNYKLPKNLNWFKYIGESYHVHSSFVEKADKDFKFLFEEYVGKKINWTKLWLFSEPTDEGGIFKIIENEEIHYCVDCAVVDNASDANYYGILKWYEASKKEIDFSEDVSELKIIFEWHPDEDNEDLDLLPSIDVVYDKKVLFSFKNYEVFTYLTSLPDEGKIAIISENIEVYEKISRLLEELRNNWNKLDKGFLHSLSFDYVYDDVAYWYIDCHGTNSEVYAYIFGELSKSDLGVIEVEIEAL